MREEQFNTLKFATNRLHIDTEMGDSFTTKVDKKAPYIITHFERVWIGLRYWRYIVNNVSFVFSLIAVL